LLSNFDHVYDDHNDHTMMIIIILSIIFMIMIKIWSQSQRVRQWLVTNTWSWCL